MVRMSDKKPKRGRPPAADGQRNKAIAVRPTPGVYAEIEELARLERRTITQMALILLEDALAARKKGGQS